MALRRLFESLSARRAALSRRGSYSREVVQTLITAVVIQLATTLAAVLLARLLGRQGRGDLAAAQVYPMVVAFLGMLGLQEAIVYFGGRDRPRASGGALVRR